MLRVPSRLICRYPCILRKQILHALIYTLWSDHRGWIKALPFLVNPDLCPGMRIELPDFPAHAIWCQLPTLIAGDDPCRNPDITHQHHETRSIVFTKALPGIKQEFINPVLSQLTRLQGINEVILLIPIQDLLHITSRIFSTLRI